MSINLFVIFIDHLLPCFAALLCGFILGYEREQRGKPAGLRTHILICVGATVYTTMSVLLGTDHSRIAAQIVSGIGFLGGGAILKEGAIVRGITTASTIWLAGAIGIVCGAKFYFEAIFITILTVIVLSFGRKVSHIIHVRESVSRFFISIQFHTFNDEMGDIKQNIIDRFLDEKIKITEFVSASYETMQFLVEISGCEKVKSYEKINNALKKSIPAGVESVVKIIDQFGNLEEDLT